MAEFMQQDQDLSTKGAPAVGPDRDRAGTAKVRGSPLEAILDHIRRRVEEGPIGVDGNGGVLAPILFDTGNVRVVDQLDAWLRWGFPNVAVPVAVDQEGEGSKDGCRIGTLGAVPIGTGVLRLQDFQHFLAGAID